MRHDVLLPGAPVHHNGDIFLFVGELGAGKSIVTLALSETFSLYYDYEGF